MLAPACIRCIISRVLIKGSFFHLLQDFCCFLPILITHEKISVFSLRSKPSRNTEKSKYLLHMYGVFITHDKLVFIKDGVGFLTKQVKWVGRYFQFSMKQCNILHHPFCHRDYRFPLRWDRDWKIPSPIFEDLGSNNYGLKKKKIQANIFMLKISSYFCTIIGVEAAQSTEKEKPLKRYEWVEK